MKYKFTRTFQMGLCGDWVEIYKITPSPQLMGRFLLAFRKKRHRSVLPIMSGVTRYGAKIMIEQLTQKPSEKLSDVLTDLVLRIGLKLDSPHKLIRIAA